MESTFSESPASSQPIEILGIGELLWDILPAATVLGGAPFNFAYRMQTLGYVSHFASRLGQDALGEEALAQVRRLGMDDRLIQIDPEHKTGIVNIGIEPDGRLDIDIVKDVAYDYIEPTEDLQKAARSSRCICFGTVAQRAPRSRSTIASLLDQAEGALKLLDINLRKECYVRDTLLDSLARADLLKLNEDEATELAATFDLPPLPLETFCEATIARWDLTCCIVTLGEKGVFAMSATGETARVASPKIAVVDTLGSGDAFTSGFLHQLFQGADLQACCRFGNALGAMVAEQHGATGPTDPVRVAELLAQIDRL